MASSSGSGEIKLIPVEDAKKEVIEDYGLNEYSFQVPEVKLVSMYEDYYPQVNFSWADDSVELRRENEVIVYTRSLFNELLAKMNSGEEVWFDGRKAPYSGTFEGKYLNKFRDGVEYTATIYNLQTMEKSIYVGALKETCPMSESEKGKYGDIKKSNQLEDKEALINIIIQNNDKYCDLNDELKNDVEFHKALIKKSYYSFGYYKYFNDNIRNSEEIINLAISKSGEVFEYLPTKYKSNKEIVIKAIKSYPKAIEFASEELKKDKDIALLICRNENALKFMDKAIYEDREFVKTILQINSSVFEILDESYKDDKEIVLLYLKYANKYTCPLRYVSSKLRNNFEVVKKAVIRDGISLQYASEALKDNKEIVKEAIRSDGDTIKYASDRLKSDKEIVNYIIENSIDSLRSIEDKELIISLLKEDKSLFNYVNYSLQNDNDIRDIVGLPRCFNTNNVFVDIDDDAPF